MTRIQELALSGDARTFAARLLSRHPDWEPFVAVYQPVNDDDDTPQGSLWIEVPSPGDPAAPLWAIVQEGEALVGLGHRAAEALYTWMPAERDEAIEDILNFIDDVAIAEVVGAWERHRFFWHTWETCRFKRAADLINNPKVVRVSGWPATLDQRRAEPGR
ncbi:MAG: hypothetical protein ACXU9O_15200 [Gemmatimonadaceae bacterium]